MAFYSSGVECGIHSLMCMVNNRGDARDMSVREIAELQGISYDYLARTFTHLSKAGLVCSTEGESGGFQLAEPAEHITVLSVVNTIDGDKYVFECREIRQWLAVLEEHPPKWACEGICSTHSVMDMVQQRIEEVLGQRTILDLVCKMYREASGTFVVGAQEWVDARKGQWVIVLDSARRSGMLNVGQTGAIVAIQHQELLLGTRRINHAVQL